MTKEQIEQIEGGNRLIAAFLGVQCIEYEINHFESSYRMADVSGNYFEGFWAYTSQQLAEDDFYNNAKYHTSWEWLMPVVEKISTIQFTDESWKGSEPYQNYAWPRTFGMRDEEGNYMVRFNASPLHTASTLIEAVWLAVVDFIKWDNQTQNK
jgi:hypothetical protein